MKIYFTFFVLLLHLSVRSQEGSLDLTFANGTGITGNSVAISKAIFQPDGKILIAGEFSSFDEVPRNNIARLNTDGSVDPTFDPGTGVTTLGSSCFLTSIALQPDGKILIGGVFSHYNGVAREGIARINADGSLDATFDPGAGANNAIQDIHVLGDGKILLTGWFFKYDNVFRAYVAMINTDGTLDTSYNPEDGFDDWIQCSTIQDDGKIIIGGFFHEFGSASAQRLARINPDGTIDNTFNVGEGPDAVVKSIAVQDDGKVLIAGEFSTYNGVSRNTLARLNTNGSLDTDYDPGDCVDGIIETLTLRADGKLLVGGLYNKVLGTDRNGIARLNADASLDLTFDPGSGVTGGAGMVNSILLQEDGKVIIAGNFSEVDGTPRGRIARLNAMPVVDGIQEPLAHLIARTDPSGSILQIQPIHPGKITIYSISGQLVENVSAYPAAILDISSYPAGMYLLKSGNQTGRFVKR